MIEGNKVLAIIPARSGSKGVPNKNIRKLSGRPLVAYTISAANQSKYIDRVIVSTDCERIAAVSQRSGAEVPFLRPENLATDTSTSAEVVKHALDAIEGFEISWYSHELPLEIVEHSGRQGMPRSLIVEF